MEKHNHPNFFKAARLLFLSGGIYIINAVFARDILSVHSNEGLGVMIISLLIFGLAWLVRRGHGWIKYLLLAGLILSLLMIQITVDELKQNPISGVVNISTTVLEVWAMVLLFMIPKRENRIVEL